MSDQQDDNATPPSAAPRLPERDLRVDFGQARPGSSNPMPEKRRVKYETRIRNSVNSQARGAEKASRLFIR